MSPSFVFPQGWTNDPFSNEVTGFDGARLKSPSTIQAETLELDPLRLPLLPQPSESPLGKFSVSCTEKE